VNQPSETVQCVIGGMMGDSAAREGVTEAARRLSHALAEMANVLDTEGRPEVHGTLSQKAKDTLKEWGVA
jgi:hypothetical protein